MGPTQKNSYKEASITTDIVSFVFKTLVDTRSPWVPVDTDFKVVPFSACIQRAHVGLFRLC